MFFKSSTGGRSVAGLVAGAVLGLGVFSTSAQAQIFQDNFLGYRYGTAFKEPGVAGGADITKNIVSYTHVSGDKYGGNFFNLDVLMSDNRDPSAGSAAGAQELYALYRRTFSYNKVTGYKGGYGGLIADFGLQFGGDVNAKNTGFAPEKRLVVAGPYIAWAVPVGFLTTAFEACHESNNNGISHKSVDFDTTFCLESAWNFPFKVGRASMAFGGFFNVVAPKGKDGFGAQTATEVLTRPEITLDIGELMGARKNFVEVGVAYEYWLNKFGNDNHTNVGSLARTPMVTARVHF